jgi:uncharacterized iron-regulated protein
MHLRIAAISLLFLAACAAPPAPSDVVHSGTAVLLLGEQHDEPGHHELQRETVQALASRGVLAALALEMAEAGTSTAGLPPQASEDEVRRALRWNDEGWPWTAYRPAVMAAVAAGLPVVGANLPRNQQRAAMADAALDRLLPGPAIKAQQQAIRIGHCGMLPESQIAPMTRVQIARDRTMADTVARLVAPGKTVVLIAGGGHADPEVGVPQYLPRGLVSKSVQLPPPLTPRRDYCEDMRRSVMPRPAS